MLQNLNILGTSHLLPAEWASYIHGGGGVGNCFGYVLGGGGLKLK